MRMRRWADLGAACLLVAALASEASAGSLENLERERALTVETMLAPDLNPEERSEKLTAAKHRLVDLERMVLRDRSLYGKNTPVVRKAFKHYDLTFLVHASVENEISLMDHWLEQVGVSTGTLMAAREGHHW